MNSIEFLSAVASRRLSTNVGEFDRNTRGKVNEKSVRRRSVVSIKISSGPGNMPAAANSSCAPSGRFFVEDFPF